MDGFREIVDVLVVDLPIDVAVGVDLLLTVRDDVRDDDLVVDDEADVAGEDLLQSGTRAGRYTFTPYFLSTASKAPISATMSCSEG